MARPVLQYVKAEVVSLKNNPQFNEAWLKQRIIDDPSIIGLGNHVVVKAVEKIQPNAGRLDLLLHDDEDDEGMRYEVEIMLGAVDASHVIRTFEYWDIERKRYPKFKHRAVLIAENVTGRFLNVIGLFSSAIPFIAIQMTALAFGDHITLQFTKVLDVIEPGGEGENIVKLSPASATQVIRVIDLGLVKRGGKRGQAISEMKDRMTVAEFKTKLEKKDLKGYAGWALATAASKSAIRLEN